MFLEFEDGYNSNEKDYCNCGCDCGCKKGYEYEGNERVDIIDQEVAGAKPHTIIYWNDNTRTTAIKFDDSEFDYELGMLICVAKKFCPGINLDKLYDATTNLEGYKQVLKQMILATGNQAAYYDALVCAKEFENNRKLLNNIAKKKAKAEVRKEERKAYIKELKKKGLWVSPEDFAKAKLENIQLKEKLQKRSMAQDYKKLLEENDKMRKELK